MNTEINDLVPSDKIARVVEYVTFNFGKWSHLPLGEAVSLIVLTEDNLELFDSPADFHAFIIREFCVHDVHLGDYYRDDVPNSFIDHWAIKSGAYSHLFAQRVRAMAWLAVPASDIILAYSYEIRNCQVSGKPCALEVFVTANFKEHV